MERYVKKPVVIEAIRYKEGCYDALLAFVPEHLLVGVLGKHKDDNNYLGIKTLEGTMIINDGDYIIKEPFDSDRQFYPCKPDIFKKTYSPVE